MYFFPLRQGEHCPLQFQPRTLGHQSSLGIWTDSGSTPPLPPPLKCFRVLQAPVSLFKRAGERVEAEEKGTRLAGNFLCLGEVFGGVGCVTCLALQELKRGRGALP